MHIVIVGQGLDGVGGVPTVARWLVDHLSAEGLTHQVVNLATSANDPYSRRLSNPKSWFRRTLLAASDRPGDTRIGANFAEWEPARYLPRTELTAILRKADVIQVVAGGPALGNAALVVGKPVVIQVATLAAWERTARGSGVRGVWDRVNTPIISFLERRALRMASAVLVENQQMADYVRTLGQQRVVLAPPGVDCTAFSPPDKWSMDGPLVSVCRLGDARKGLERMLRAYAMLIQQRPQTPTLVLAGAGPVPQPLKALVHELGLGKRVLLRPDVSLSELKDLYRSGSFFLQTSYEEGLGLSSVEAMACGLPVVTSRTAGSAMVVDDGVTGVLVEEGLEFEMRFAQALIDAFNKKGGNMPRLSRERALKVFSDSETFVPYRNIYSDLT